MQVMNLEQINEMPATDCVSFSLKAYPAAFFFAMQACKLDSFGEAVTELLDACAEEIRSGHRVDFAEGAL